MNIGAVSGNSGIITETLKSNKPTLFDVIHNTESRTETADILFGAITRNSYAPRDKIMRGPDAVAIWLQYPNDIIKNLALEIVNSNDSNDIKMEKIQRWVVENIEYATDKEQYGYEELWVPPVMTLHTMKGDCEDGAFLIMSLALNAGVDPSRLRMYGGFVDAGRGAASGGHGWVAYSRELDDEWVAVDFSYYPDLRPMGKRLPLKEDMKYVDDYFFITSRYTVITEDTNRIREPEVYFDNAMQPNIFFPTGSLLSVWV
ncbi:MAG: hypothetical protein HKO91_12005 [Desulfobacterales bacterium]|nr:hypothetical protein [Desulfobacterales bacterium]